MSARYVVLPKADTDLDDEAYYLVEEAGLEAGLSFLAAARETFGLLADHPGMGWKCRLEHRSLASARVFRVTRFERILVFYRPCSTGIEIMRVLHSSQDLEELFGKEDAPD